jgi:hypothetical protein
MMRLQLTTLLPLLALVPLGCDDGAAVADVIVLDGAAALDGRGLDADASTNDDTGAADDVHNIDALRGDEGGDTRDATPLDTDGGSGDDGDVSNAGDTSADGVPDGVAEDGGEAGDGGCESTCGGECIAGRCRETIAGGLFHPYNLAVNATHIFWTSTYTDEPMVMRVPLAIGMPEVLATGPACHSIVVEGNDVYWTELLYRPSGSIKTVPIVGGVAVTIASIQDNPHALGVDKTHVYWANWVDSGEVWKASRADGTLTPLAAGQAKPVRLAIDDKFVYWTNRVPGTGTVMKVPLDGSSGPIEVARDQDEPYGIAVDKTNLYWTSLGSKKVMKVPLDGSGPPVTLADLQGGVRDLKPLGLAVDATHVYWTVYSEQDKAATGALRRVPIEGGPWTELAEAQSYDVILDEIGVYWTKWGDDQVANGAIYRMHK